MLEHYCKDCKNSEGDVCVISGATHRTGIECPSFEAKEEEVEMNFRVRETDDIYDLWVVADGDTCITTHNYIQSDGTVREIGSCELYQTKDEAEDALDLYRNKQCQSEPTVAEYTARTFAGHPEGVLEIKVDPADPCGGSTAVYKKDTSVESYKSGATRTQCETKIDPEGFFSPLVVLRYSEYMHKCRVQANGTLRDSDNWQGGIPLWRYMKGKWRHFLDTWLIHRGYKKTTDEGLSLQDCLCAEMFNTMGYLHEVLCTKKGVTKDQDVPAPGGAHANFKDRTSPTKGGY